MHEDHAQWAETSHCRVASVRHFGSFAAVELIAPKVARRAAPGQFVMVTVPGGGFQLLRRPISLFAVHGDRVGLLIEARGCGHGAPLPARGVGDAVDLAGPLGSAFPVEGVTNALLVGGGIGCAPLQCLADALVAEGAQVTAAFGFRDFRSARAAGAFTIDRLWVATEDGSVGRAGTALHLLAALDVAPGTTVYACGPTPMIAGGAALDVRRGLARLRLAGGAHGLRHGLVPRLCGRHRARQAPRVQRGAGVRLDEVTP